MMLLARLHHKRLPVRPYQTGFNLIEMAIVLVIAGVLLGGLITPFSTQLEVSKRKGTERQLNDIHDAILGFAAATGRLPCPATATSNGQSSPTTATTACTTANGFVPGRTLGLNGAVNANMLITDPWLNPVRYSVSTADAGNYTSALSLVINPDLRVCREAACTNVITDIGVAIIFSLGEDGTTTTSPDQIENTDNDNIFVTRTKSEQTGNEFDDHLIWISPHTLVYQLVKAGQLN